MARHSKDSSDDDDDDDDDDGDGSDDNCNEDSGNLQDVSQLASNGTKFLVAATPTTPTSTTPTSTTPTSTAMAPTTVSWSLRKLSRRFTLGHHFKDSTAMRTARKALLAQRKDRCEQEGLKRVQQIDDGVVGWCYLPGNSEALSVL